MILKEADIEVPFDDFETAGNIDILSPFSKLVQKDGLLLGEEDEEDKIVRRSSVISRFLINSLSPISLSS